MNNTKCSFIAITGKPNVGKSSLLNKIIGEKLAIVSQKPQTTRNKITGILTEDNVQLVFLDTPGFHKPKNKLGEHMMKTVADAADGADAIVFVREGKEITENENELLEKIFKYKGVKRYLVINKTDLQSDKSVLLRSAEIMTERYNFDAVFYTSTKDGSGIEDLKNELKNSAPDSPYYFPDEYYSAEPEKFIVSEMIREQILLKIRDEIPHGTAVEIEKMTDREESNITDISAVIYCEKESHKGIVIGGGGKMLKDIGSAARKEIENFLDRKVSLKLWVKVRADWRNKESNVRDLGF